jgi:hypothetical protein
MVAEIIVWIAIAMLSTMLGIVSGGLGCLVSLVYPILWLGILILHVIAIVKGVNGGRLIIPGVSEYANRF